MSSEARCGPGLGPSAVAARRGVILDMGDVLFDATGWRRWLAEELGRQGLPITYGGLVAKWERLLEDVYCGRADYWARFRELLLSLGLPASNCESVAAEARRVALAVQEERRLFPEVSEVLRQLDSCGVRLAVLSDSESRGNVLWESLDRLGIGGFFRAVVTSRDTGVTKPAAAAYQAAVSELGLTAEECAFVGHDSEELKGAMRAGLLAIAWNADPDVPAHLRLTSFRGLCSLAMPISGVGGGLT
jgi:putative hydrolase of the HAD superfamily